MLSADFMPAIMYVTERAEDWRDRAARGIAQGNADVIDMFRTEQLSGRNADDSGLNMRTGNLFNSLEGDVEILGHTITGTVENHDADYWFYHQNGLGHNPKRLTLEERFADRGMEIYLGHLEPALAKAFT